MNYPSISKIGRKQRDVLIGMCQGMVIKSIDDYSNHVTNIYLQDEEHNIFDTLSMRFVDTLIDRNLLTKSTITPSVDISVTTFKVKAKLKEEIYYMLTGKLLNNTAPPVTT